MKIAVADAGIHYIYLYVIVAYRVSCKLVWVEGVVSGKHGEAFCRYSVGFCLSVCR